MELLEILWQLLTLPFIYVDVFKMTGFEAFFWIVVGYFVYLFLIAFGIALFQMPFKGSDYRDDYC